MDNDQLDPHVDDAPVDPAPNTDGAAAETVESGPLEDEHGMVAGHVVEHRSFGRAEADTPMPVTVITTRDSLAASNTGA